MKVKDIPIPENWPQLIRRAMIHAAALAHFDIVYAWSKAADSAVQNVRIKARLDKLQTDLSRKENQLRIIMARLERVPAKHRPYYLPEERMSILNHKAACGWNLEQTAKAFQVDASTVSSWMKRLDAGSLVKIPVPWNKYPSYLRYAVQQLKAVVPRMGKKKIAEYFVRGGLYLAATTVGRYLKSKPQPELPVEPEPVDSADNGKKRFINSKHPNHTWTVDLTSVPTSGGLWTSWMPNLFPLRWPFCWWVLVVMDHFSRKAVGFALFRKQPTSAEVTQALDKAVEQVGKAPKHIISDKGSQFFCGNYKDWCAGNNVKPRFGAVGQHGSIAVTERFIKSLKYEYTGLISVPLNFDDMRQELALYFTWYNEYRPHKYLKARTPEEVYNHSPPKTCFKLIHGNDVPDMELQVSFLEGRKQLPVIELKLTA